MIPRLILEQIIEQSIYNHLEEQKLVGSNQHGSVKSKLCQANLISFYDRVTGLVDKKDAIDVISLDFCKPLILSYLTFSSTDWGDLISATQLFRGCTADWTEASRKHSPVA